MSRHEHRQGRVNWPSTVISRISPVESGTPVWEDLSSLFFRRARSRMYSLPSIFSHADAIEAVKAVIPSAQSQPYISSSSPDAPCNVLHLSGSAVAEAAGSLGALLLGNRDDVDGDRIELDMENVSLLREFGARVSPPPPLSMGGRGGLMRRTPRCFSRSLVSTSMSSWPLSEFWAKSRAETSGTY